MFREGEDSVVFADSESDKLEKSFFHGPGSAHDTDDTDNNDADDSDIDDNDINDSDINDNDADDTDDKAIDAGESRASNKFSSDNEEDAVPRHTKMAQKSMGKRNVEKQANQGESHSKEDSTIHLEEGGQESNALLDLVYDIMPCRFEIRFK
jgi:hypothetical protein